MATNTLLQRLDTAGNTTGSSSFASNRVQYEEFIADGAIAAGAPVMFDLAETADADKVLKVVESSADKACIGVSLETAAVAAGDRVRVCLSGLCEALVKGTNNAGNAAIAVGDYLCQGDVAGEFYKFTAGTDAVPHAVAADAVSSGAAAALVTVVVLKQF